MNNESSMLREQELYKQELYKKGLYIGAAGGLLLIALGLIWVMSNATAPPEVMLPTMLIDGMLILLLALGALALLFASMQIGDPNQPLGLPQGSIQSLIALGLIIIFMITAVYLFSSLLKPTITTSENLTQDQVTQLLPRLVTMTNVASSDPPRYNVELRNDANQASIDMAKQIMTMIGTLLVTVIGFYFGTRAAMAGAAMTSPETSVTSPVIIGVVPNKGSNADESPVQVTVTGANFVKATRFELRQKDLGHSVEGPAMAQSASQLTVSLNLKGVQKGKWTPTVINPDGSQVELPDGFEVTE